MKFALKHLWKRFIEWQRRVRGRCVVCAAQAPVFWGFSFGQNAQVEMRECKRCSMTWSTGRSIPVEPEEPEPESESLHGGSIVL